MATKYGSSSPQRRLDCIKLTWRQGTADVKATFKGRKHEVNVSTYGMAILLVYNDVPVGESLTFEVGMYHLQELDVKSDNE